MDTLNSGQRGTGVTHDTKHELREIGEETVGLKELVHLHSTKISDLDQDALESLGDMKLSSATTDQPDLSGLLSSPSSDAEPSKFKSIELDNYFQDQHTPIKSVDREFTVPTDITGHSLEFVDKVDKPIKEINDDSFNFGSTKMVESKKDGFVDSLPSLFDEGMAGNHTTISEESMTENDTMSSYFVEPRQTVVF